MMYIFTEMAGLRQTSRQGGLLMGRGCAVVLVMVLVAPLAARGEEVAQPVPADGKCAVPADNKNWTKQEKFVWERVCVGRIANFNNEPGYGGNLDPSNPDGWPANRVLSSAFLETILLKDKYRRALTRRGVYIVGARFEKTIDLENAELGHELWLDGSLLEGGANFRRLRSTHLIGLSGSKVIGKLNMNSLQVDASLFMRDKAVFAEVDLRVAHVGWQLDLEGSKVTGKLDMNGLRVDKDLFMRGGAEFAEVVLVGAHVGGQLSLIRSKVTGKIDMNSLQVGQHLLMGGGAEFAEVDLGYAHVGGGLDLAGSIFHKDVNLTGAQVADELRLGSSDAWAHRPTIENPTLILRNARADAIQDLSYAWPDRLDLNGFTYRSLGGLNAAERDPMAERSVAWFEGWLGRQERYTPQPYEQLALILRNHGRPDVADDILYAGKERERADALKRWQDGNRSPDQLQWMGLTVLDTIPDLLGLLQIIAPNNIPELFRWLWLTALDKVMGYGYHIEWTLYWVVGFVLIGWGVLSITRQRHKHEVPIGLAYSVDMLLPLVKLREKHYKIDLDPWPRRYFYVHKIIGYVLASFLIAGLSGLTK